MIKFFIRKTREIKIFRITFIFTVWINDSNAMGDDARMY